MSVFKFFFFSYKMFDRILLLANYLKIWYLKKKRKKYKVVRGLPPALPPPPHRPAWPTLPAHVEYNSNYSQFP